MQPSTLKDFHKERSAFQPTRIGMVNLGCARNTVDSRNILDRLHKKGHRLVLPEQADVVIVNTCSFIDAAKKESIDTILELAELKKKGTIKKIIVAGCLSQRYGLELVKELPEVDAFVGVLALKQNMISGDVSITPPHYSYLKISESCYNKCSFCIIPKIKGRFTSRTMENILEEVRILDARGGKELNLVGQDITAYGMDLFREKRLAELLRRVVKECHHIEWVRLLYAYPAHVTDELIETIAAEPKICKYVDMPLQHINDRILKAMKRGITTSQTIELVRKIRKTIPGVFLRTTFIVGFPGETDAEFEELLNFVRESRFERVGVFTYSREEGTEAYGLPDHVSDALKKERFDRLMQVQQDISRDFLQSLIGREMRVLIEERVKDSPDTYLGRSEYDAPDVDGEIHVRINRPLKIGQFAQVRITGSMEYDLLGEAI